MRMTLGQYITAVNLVVDELTNGAMSLDDLVDFSEGELSLSDMHDSGVTPRNAAYKILVANGADWL